MASFIQLAITVLLVCTFQPKTEAITDEQYQQLLTTVDEIRRENEELRSQLNATENELESRYRNVEDRLFTFGLRLQSVSVDLSQLVDRRFSELQTYIQQNGHGGAAEPIGFHASMTAYTPLVDGFSIIYNVANLNVGDGFDARTGEFTVPPGGSGLYYFSTYNTVQNADRALIAMFKDTTPVCAGEGDGNNSGNDNTVAACSAVVSLSEGDTVKVALIQSPDFYPFDINVNHWNLFNGFRISAHETPETLAP